MKDPNIRDGDETAGLDDPEKASEIGGLGGAVIGAAAGSVVGPVGSIIGAVTGGLIAAGLSGLAVTAVESLSHHDAAEGDAVTAEDSTDGTGLASTDGNEAPPVPPVLENVRIGGLNIVTGEPTHTKDGGVGAISGAVLGGIIGTVAGGPIGTVLGGVAGAMVGGVAGDFVEAAEDERHEEHGG